MFFVVSISVLVSHRNSTAKSVVGMTFGLGLTPNFWSGMVFGIRVWQILESLQPTVTWSVVLYFMPLSPILPRGHFEIWLKTFWAWIRSKIRSQDLWMFCCRAFNLNSQSLSNFDYALWRKGCPFVSNQSCWQISMFCHYIKKIVCRNCGRCVRNWVGEKISWENVRSGDYVFISPAWV